MMKKNVPQTVSILGMSKTGISTSRYLAKLGVHCLVSDSKPETSFAEDTICELASLGIEVELGGHTEKVYDCDLCIVSPGIPYTTPVIQKFQDLGIETISDIELCYRLVDKPFICITGANGKSTITSLVSKILSDYGYKAPPIGNIGNPIINYIEENLDYYVVEISSFQIYYSPTLKPFIAIYTNYSPDHIDWHLNEAHYRQTKESLFTRLDSNCWAILNEGDPILYELAGKTQAKKFFSNSNTKNPYTTYLENAMIFHHYGNRGQLIVKTDELNLVGHHNYENVMAAAAVGLILDIPVDCISQSIKTFKPVEHRLELLELKSPIQFYNDSKATNPESSVCALKALAGRDIILIAGGKDKMTSLGEFVTLIKAHVRTVILIGQAAERFENALREAEYDHIIRADSLESAILRSKELAKEVVLFSPGCSSFDMFNNFEERGRAFKNHVSHLYQ